jgi:hypothetical protein
VCCARSIASRRRLQVANRMPRTPYSISYRSLPPSRQAAKSGSSREEPGSAFALVARASLIFEISSCSAFGDGHLITMPLDRRCGRHHQKAA